MKYNSNFVQLMATVEAKSRNCAEFACDNCDPNSDVFDWIDLNIMSIKPFAYILGTCMYVAVPLLRPIYFYIFMISINFPPEKAAKQYKNDKSYNYFNIKSITSTFYNIE